jgi:CheY-like chemotaxis protein
VKRYKKTIVFVDDDKVQHMINKRILEKMNRGLKMVFFEDPFDALEWLSNNYTDVILLDINMPKMDGGDFLKRMEAKGIDGNVKMLTASIDPEDINKSKEFKLNISIIWLKTSKEMKKCLVQE